MIGWLVFVNLVIVGGFIWGCRIVRVAHSGVLKDARDERNYEAWLALIRESGTDQ